MVSKSKILGKPIIILITVGTTTYRFTRLFKEVDEYLTNRNLNYQLIVQQGISDYSWQYKKVAHYYEMSPALLINSIKKANFVITHAGFGTLYTLSKVFQYMPLVVSRLCKYSEHVNDHQLFFNNFMMEQTPLKYHKYFINRPSELKDGIKYYLQKCKDRNIFNQYIFNTDHKQLNYRLDKYIRNK